MLTSSSTMASSLERSLELAAIHSDGLSDKEKQVRAVKNTIKGHRRTHSVSASAPVPDRQPHVQNPQQLVNISKMSVVDEMTSSESDDCAVDI